MRQLNFFQGMLVAALLLVAFSFVAYFTIFSEKGPFARSNHYYVIYFDHTAGVEVGSRVTIKGVAVGKVSSLDLETVNHAGLPVEPGSGEGEKRKVAVTVELKSPLALYENYSVSIEKESLLSGKVIAIDPGSLLHPVTGARFYSRIPVLTVTREELRTLGLSAHQYVRLKSREVPHPFLVGQREREPLTELGRLGDASRDDIGRIVGNLKDITNKIDHGSGTLGLLMNDDELTHDMQILLNDARLSSRHLREGSEDDNRQDSVNSLRIGFSF